MIDRTFTDAELDRYIKTETLAADGTVTSKETCKIAEVVEATHDVTCAEEEEAAIAVLAALRRILAGSPVEVIDEGAGGRIRVTLMPIAITFNSLAYRAILGLQR